MLKKKIKFREMRLNDIPAVVKLEESSFPTPWTYWIFFQELISPQRFYLVAELGGEVIGYAGMSWLLDEGHITTLAVDREHRRQGIGSMLLEKLIDRARSLGLRYLTLEVRESNIPAQKLYHKYGFVVEGKRHRYYYNPREDAVIMTLYFRATEE